jgi:peroxiredoxin
VNTVSLTGRGVFGLMLCLAAQLPGLASAATLAEQMALLQIDVPRERLPAPEFELQSLDGKLIRLEDFRGSLVLLNFWATFCKPCRDEMPAMAALFRRFRDQGLVVLAVAVDRGNRRAVDAFVKRHSIEFPVPLDPEGSARKRYEIDALPTSYLIGRDGRFVGRAIGEKQWDSPEIKQLIHGLLLSE